MRAWWAQQEWDSDEYRIVYQTEWVGDDGERYAEAKAQVEREIREKYLTPDPGPRPWYPPSPWDILHGVSPGIGFRFPVPDRPYRFQITERPTYLADIFPVRCGEAISERVVEAIEQVEPGVHQYLPCELYQPDGSPIPERRWILNNCNRFDSVALGHCNVVELSQTGKIAKGNGKTDIKVWRDVVAGHALWTDWRIMNSPLYVADALVERLRAMAAHGWRFDHHLPEFSKTEIPNAGEQA
ncbi:MAG TPA: DUF1629 domain-containing protein [Novosphingobium sp.]|nr:DUF1629 domain-containing protein [Novosphingobium sp.]